MKLYNQVRSKSTLLFSVMLYGVVVADVYSILKDEESWIIRNADK
jgi:hypothetical protein